MVDSFQNNQVSTFPDITAVSFIKINQNYLKVIVLNFFAFFIPLFIGLVLLHQLVFSEELIKYIFSIYAGFTIIFGYILIHAVFAFYKRKYSVRERDISYKSGLFIHRMTTVPFSRIQHVEIDEKPISRIFGLASISVFTAGDSSDDLVIKGITREEAEQIKEFISNKINE